MCPKVMFSSASQGQLPAGYEAETDCLLFLVVRAGVSAYRLRPSGLIKAVPDPGDRFAVIGDAEFPFLDVRNLNARIPRHCRPIFLVLNGVFLTQNATFAVAVLMPPLDDMGSRDGAPATLAFPLRSLLGYLLIDFVHVHLVPHPV
jgi:hypothetical protein